MALNLLADQGEDEELESQKAEEPEKEPEQDPEPEAKEEEAQPEPEPEKSDRVETVPFSVFEDMKRENKQYRALMQEQSEQIKALTEKFSSFTAEKPPEAPSYDDDPLGHLRHQQQSFAQETKSALDALKDELKKGSEQTSQQVQQQKFETLENAFAKENPDYWQAIEHLGKTRSSQYELLGHDPDEARTAYLREAAWFVQNAAQRGKNPFQVAYDLAKQMGWKSPDPAPQEQPQEQAKPKPKADSEVLKTLKDIAKAQQASQTLASSGGKTEKQELDISSAAELDDDAFDKAFVGPDGDKRWRAFMKQQQG